MPELQEGQEVQPLPVEEPAVQTLDQHIADIAPEPNTDVEDDGDEVEDGLQESFSWQASEFVFHEKPAMWYVVLFCLALALGAGLLLLQQWFGAAVVAVMTLAILVWSKKAPRVLDYRLDDHGITIHDKPYPYAQFKSFSIHHELAWISIDLEPAKRLVPRLSLICETNDENVIESILANHLPRHDRTPDLVERITKAIKF